jgi:hypothetical protein
LLDETVRSREVLSNQVMALHREAERSYDERSELRQLLSVAQNQLQEVVASLLAARPSEPRAEAPAAGPKSIQGARPAPQRRSSRKSSPARMSASAIRKWIANR